MISFARRAMTEVREQGPPRKGHTTKTNSAKGEQQTRSGSEPPSPVGEGLEARSLVVVSERSTRFLTPSQLVVRAR